MNCTFPTRKWRIQEAGGNFEDGPDGHLLIVELCREEAGDALDYRAHGEGAVAEHLKIPEQRPYFHTENGSRRCIFIQYCNKNRIFTYNTTAGVAFSCKLQHRMYLI